MPNKAAFIPPPKKHSIMWWLGGFFFLLLLLFFYQLFGPNPPIIVSRETTYVTEPLKPNGLPDYEQYVLDLYRNDVTPENNAAIPLLQLLFPSQVSPTDLRAIVDELGMEEAAPSRDSLEVVVGETNRAAPWRWLFPRWTSQKNLLNVDAWAERMTGQAVWRPWTSDQAPPLAKWLASNKQSLDLILEASRRPRYFAPSPTLLNDTHDLLVNMVFPQRNNLLIVLTQTIREACRVLLARAMWHLGEGRTVDAWQDLQALHRLSGLLSQGLTFIERSCARDVSTMACYATETLLHLANLTVDEARQIHRDLIQLQPLSGEARSLEHHERLFALDVFVYVGSGGEPDQLNRLVENLDLIFGPIESSSIDWNIVLRETNRGYDRLAAAVRLSDRAARTRAMKALEKDLRARLARRGRTLSEFADEGLSRHERSQLFGDWFLGLIEPQRALAAEDRANAKLELTRLAAALAIYRAEHERYPEKLESLVPGILKEPPRDLFHAKPYIYQPERDGYLLYSTGEDGVDDDGRNAQTYFLESPPFDERGRLGRNPAEPQPEILMGGDDISIRVPRPHF
ncbi:MAG: hypothetical protein WD738_15990 [Pirellulales bacterium]